MYIYSLNYWDLFPSSECGGIIVILAEDDTSAIEILKCNSGYPGDLPEEETTMIVTNALEKCNKFLVETDRKAGVITAFIAWGNETGHQIVGV